MRGIFLGVLMAAAVLPAVGCQATHPRPLDPALSTVPLPDMPRELNKVVLPTYTIEPPDILEIFQGFFVLP